MNKKQPYSPKSDRRNFLPKEKPDLAKAPPSKGYHETPHIQAYYKSLRNP